MVSPLFCIILTTKFLLRGAPSFRGEGSFDMSLSSTFSLLLACWTTFFLRCQIVTAYCLLLHTIQNRMVYRQGKSLKEQSKATAEFLREIQRGFASSPLSKEEFLPFFALDNTSTEEISSHALITHNIRSLMKLLAANCRVFLGCILFNTSCEDFLDTFLTHRSRPCDSPAQPAPAAPQAEQLTCLDQLVRIAMQCNDGVVPNRNANTLTNVPSLFNYFPLICTFFASALIDSFTGVSRVSAAHLVPGAQEGRDLRGGSPWPAARPASPPPAAPAESVLHTR
jgi:hypothetical protein